MSVIKRQDTVLPLGLTLALVVIFQRPLRYFLDVAHDLESRWGLALVPGLAILAVVLLFHWQRRRHDRQLERSARSIEQSARGRRTEELDTLVGLGQALARANSMEGLRDVAQRHVPELVAGRGYWALIRSGGKWEAIAGGLPGSPERASPLLESIADHVLQLGAEALTGAEGAEWEGHVCFPLIVGDTALGVLGVRRTAEADGDGEDWRRLMASAAEMIAIGARNVQLIHEIQEHGAYDGLTGCFNRTHAMKVLDAELQRARRAQTALAVVMLDLDHFKAVNDRNGHLCGDALLTAVGRRMRELLRNSDVKCRYGGEEFLVMLPDTRLEGAAHVAESLRKEISNTTILWNSESVATTASFGIAVSHAGELDARALIGRADAALYRAKNEGRNRVCVESELPAKLQIPEPPKVESIHDAFGERRRLGPRSVD
jgi:diguanylate cyclase (GGDEF)-like protein